MPARRVESNLQIPFNSLDFDPFRFDRKLRALLSIIVTGAHGVDQIGETESNMTKGEARVGWERLIAPERGSLVRGF